MAYSEQARESSNKYRREKYQRVSVGFTKNLWDSYLSPSISASGMSLSAFTRMAIIEKVLRESHYLSDEERDTLTIILDKIRNGQ